jgi:oligopeptide transport system ATP-binding protein
MTYLLEVKNLVTKFRLKESTVHAVNGISYSINAGESIAIVGESGSGKSVGVKSLIRLIPTPPGKIEDGQVLFRDVDLLQLSEEEIREVRGKEITMIFQDPMTSLNPVLTVSMQLTESLILHLKLSKDQAKERAAEMLGLVGIPDAADRMADYPHQFSGGQRQRIMIAMALSTNPALLIADEPTTALDVTIQAQIMDVVNRLKEKFGMAIIWITHDLAVVAGLVDRVLVMYGGFIVEDAPVRDLYKHTSHPYTKGLLESLPAVDGSGGERLIPIEGSPPDMTVEPTFCPFAPRCNYAIEKCWNENPPLESVAPDHSAACWRWADVRAGVKA